MSLPSIPKVGHLKPESVPENVLTQSNQKKYSLSPLSSQIRYQFQSQRRLLIRNLALGSAIFGFSLGICNLIIFISDFYSIQAVRQNDVTDSFLEQVMKEEEIQRKQLSSTA